MREKLMQAVILTFLLKVVMGLDSHVLPQNLSPWQSNSTLRLRSVTTPTISETIVVGRD